MFEKLYLDMNIVEKVRREETGIKYLMQLGFKMNLSSVLSYSTHAYEFDWSLI